MVPKSIQTRVIGIITDEMAASLHTFSWKPYPLLENKMWAASCLLLSLLLLFVYFLALYTIPTYFSLISCFLYTFMISTIKGHTCQPTSFTWRDKSIAKIMICLHKAGQ